VYTVTLTVTDNNGGQNTIKKIITVSPLNKPPNTPSTPSGPITGLKKTTYTYTTDATDPNGDSLYYTWNWGDGSSGWIGPYASGVISTATHKWNKAGTYPVQVKVRDIYGVESGWSQSLTVTISK
jgi:PKD repeat protein